MFVSKFLGFIPVWKLMDSYWLAEGFCCLEKSNYEKAKPGFYVLFGYELFCCWAGGLENESKSNYPNSLLELVVPDGWANAPKSEKGSFFYFLYMSENYDFSSLSPPNFCD